MYARFYFIVYNRNIDRIRNVEKLGTSSQYELSAALYEYGKTLGNNPKQMAINNNNKNKSNNNIAICRLFFLKKILRTIFVIKQVTNQDYLFWNP